MHINLKQAANEAFYTSLYELDRLIADRQCETPGDDITLLEISDDPANVPDCYSDFSDVFSKAESNKLPPHRPYDHKITLDEGAEASLKYSPLYKMSLEELEVTKQYLIDNLDKGFIEPS